MKVGLVGLPNVGKSTIFNNIVGQELARASNFPFCTIDPNSASAQVIDKRIDALAEISNSSKIIYPRIECVDIAGLVEGASQGAGLGNQFLAHIREVDLILHVVRCFSDPGIQHVRNAINPVSDANLINAELLIADIDMCEKILSNRKTNKLYTKEQIKALEKAIQVLQKDTPIRDVIDQFTQEELKFIDQRGLITAKPMLYVANIDDLSDLKDIQNRLNSAVVPIDPFDEGQSINELIKLSYKTLGLITFYTTGPMESRGWSIRNGTNAKQAAGVIHTDFTKKFIAAAVINYSDFINNNQIKTEGAKKIRTEGANYVVQDGDICEFRVGR